MLHRDVAADRHIGCLSSFAARPAPHGQIGRGSALHGRRTEHRRHGAGSPGTRSGARRAREAGLGGASLRVERALQRGRPGSRGSRCGMRSSAPRARGRRARLAPARKAGAGRRRGEHPSGTAGPTHPARGGALWPGAMARSPHSVGCRWTPMRHPRRRARSGAGRGCPGRAGCRGWAGCSAARRGRPDRTGTRRTRGLVTKADRTAPGWPRARARPSGLTCRRAMHRRPPFAPRPAVAASPDAPPTKAGPKVDARRADLRRPDAGAEGRTRRRAQRSRAGWAPRFRAAGPISDSLRRSVRARWFDPGHGPRRRR